MKTKVSILLIFGLFTFLNSAYTQRGPRIKGSDTEWKNLIKKEMVYPQDSYSNKIEGKVEIRLSLSAEGKITGYDILKSPAKDLSEEIIRLSKYLFWEPAKDFKSRDIEGSYLLRYSFKIKKYNKLCEKRGYKSLKKQEHHDTSFIVYESNVLDISPSPSFPDPLDTFTIFMTENFKYPENAKNIGLQGDVELSFIIEASGNITNLKKNKTLGAGCTEEAIRLLNLINWRPGMKDGKYVRSYGSFKISFDLKKSNFQYQHNAQGGSI
jgi:TonB family protein